MPSPSASIHVRARYWATSRLLIHWPRLLHQQVESTAGYHRQAQVENAFFRYKLIIGDGLRARSPGGRVTEAVIACNILNQMTEIGRPESYRIGR